MRVQLCDVPGGSHGNDREVTINVKRGVEAKNYGDVRRFTYVSLSALIIE